RAVVAGGGTPHTGRSREAGSMVQAKGQRSKRGRTAAARGVQMHVGMGVIFQGEGEGRTDRNVYRNELRLGDLAEPLGFDSLWGVEHHFTDYTMCPDVLLYLTYFAGRTQRIQLGSMVVVLPWHSPLRVAEQVVMLDHMSNGRLILGLGRGLGRVEFEGFGVNQEDSRAIFSEAAQMILEGLERGYCEFDGRFVQQKRRELRPRPFKSFRGRTYAAAVSPESSVIMAGLGLGLQIYGTPEQCYEKVLDIQKRTGAEAFNGVFSYGGMPYDLAESSLRLFASEVMPELKRHIPAEDQLIARAGVGPTAAPGSFRLGVVAT